MLLIYPSKAVLHNKQAVASFIDIICHNFIILKVLQLGCMYVQPFYKELYNHFIIFCKNNIQHELHYKLLLSYNCKTLSGAHSRLLLYLECVLYTVEYKRRIRSIICTQTYSYSQRSHKHESSLYIII